MPGTYNDNKRMCFRCLTRHRADEKCSTRDDDNDCTTGDDTTMDTDLKKKYEEALGHFWKQLTPMVAEFSKTRREQAESTREMAKRMRAAGGIEKAAKLEGMAEVYEESAEHVKKLVDDPELQGLFVTGPPWFQVALEFALGTAEDIDKFFKRDKEKTKALKSIADSLLLKEVRTDQRISELEKKVRVLLAGG